MQPLTRVTSRAVVLADEHIDTDRIIPARFLTTTSSDGLGKHAFADWRKDPACPFNDERAVGAQIIVAGDNFGCGSSREHAAWALADLGVRVVISTRIADIFRNNAQRNGILPVVAEPEPHAALMAEPYQTIEVDLEAQRVTPERTPAFGFQADAFARVCLLQGVDHLGYLLTKLDTIEAFDRRAEAAAP